MRVVSVIGVVALSASAAGAGGIDRSGQSIGILFEEGRYAELSFGRVAPDVSGIDLTTANTGDVALDYNQISLGYKYDINDRLSFAVILDQPFGADLEYGPSSPLFGGTTVEASAAALTGILRYKFNENFSVHGGLRADRADGNITLRGLAYGSAPPAGFNGYNVDLASDTALGYVAGIAYERPDIALRVALTYNSSITHEFDTVENINPGATTTTEVDTPQSINLDFQTGIAADTLLFGQIRWVDWSNFKLEPLVFTASNGGEGLISLDDTTTYTVGVGRRFSDSWAGSISFTYEKELDPLVSPLAPTNGRMGVTLAGVYTSGDMKITTGINYTSVGDAQPETGTPDTARANFTDNDSVGVGIKIGYSF